ncbi:unnamed protein product [Caenorhabditis brenneri]
MTTSDSTILGTRVSLCNVDMWEKFYPVNEMVVIGAGQKLFPGLRVKIEGLDPKVLYTVSLYLERVNDFTYKFKRDELSATGGNWEADKPVNQPFPMVEREHIDGKKDGAHWMKFPVSFFHIHITNSSNFENNSKINQIFVQSMQKYQPVVVVKRIDTGFQEEFRLTMTEFIAVARYHNSKIKELKTKNNTFCKVKNHKKSQGRTPSGRKRAITTDDCNSTSSSTVSSSSNTAARSYKKLGSSRSSWIPPIASPMTPFTMVAPPSFPSTFNEPPFGNPNNFQHLMMTDSAVLTHPPSSGPNGYQDQTFLPPTPTDNVAMNQSYNPTGHLNQPSFQPNATPAHLATPSAHDFSMNQHYQSFEMCNESQIDGVFMPPQNQSNTIPGYNFSQDNAHFGDITDMQMDNDFFPPSPY